MENFTEIDRTRYPGDNIDLEYEKNHYVNQRRDLKIFYEEDVGEELLNSPTTYPDTKILILLKSLI